MLDLEQISELCAELLWSMSAARSACPRMSTYEEKTFRLCGLIVVGFLQAMEL
jgi:hypothetical protein